MVNNIQYPNRLTVHISDDLKERLDSMAMNEQKKRSEVVRQILSEGANKQ